MRSRPGDSSGGSGARECQMVTRWGNPAHGRSRKQVRVGSTSGQADRGEHRCAVRSTATATAAATAAAVAAERWRNTRRNSSAPGSRLAGAEPLGVPTLPCSTPSGTDQALARVPSRDGRRRCARGRDDRLMTMELATGCLVAVACAGSRRRTGGHLRAPPLLEPGPAEAPEGLQPDRSSHPAEQQGSSSYSQSCRSLRTIRRQQAT
jgi:hypothetical protein